VSLVTLVSGGLDSTLMSLLAKEEGIDLLPLFVDYGQLCRDQELKACIAVHQNLGLPRPALMSLRGFGELISSGLTDPRMRINEDAFLPGRNLLFLLAGAAYAYQHGARAVAIGLLSDKSCIYPDQTTEFLEKTQQLVELTMGRGINIVAPLMTFTKTDVLRMARNKGISCTWSCHASGDSPCGLCVSCTERINATDESR